MGSESLEYNIIVVKWGDKFTSEHVNRLYRMAKRNITLPFNFYCYTEDSNGIYDEVNIIPLDKTLNLEKWWWKLTLFKENKLGNGINLFLDLDVVIQDNIDYFFKKAKHDKICIIEYNQSEISSMDVDPKTEPYYNSSIMIWYNNEHHEIYKKFINQYKLYTKVYHGIDRFFSYEISPTKFFGLDDKDYYYRNLIRENEIPNQSYFITLPKGTIRYAVAGKTTVYFNENIPICVFNGCHEDVFYQGMENFLL
jgi:hypothetical protein